MKRLARGLLWFILLPFMILLAGAGFLVSTQTGLDGLLDVARRVLPGELTYGRAQGRLIGPLELERLRYKDADLEISLDGATFDWIPSALLHAELKITELTARGITLHLPPSPPAAPDAEKKPLKLSDISLPVRVEIANLAIDDLRIYPFSAQQPLIIDQVYLKAHTEDKALVLETAGVRAPQGDLQLSGRLTPLGSYPLSLDLNWNYRHPQYGRFEGQGTVAGELLETLSLTHRLAGPVTAQLEGELRSALQQPEWSARLQTHIPDLKVFSPELNASELSAQLQTQGRLDGFQAGGEMSATLPEIGRVNANFALSGDTQQIRVEQMRVAGSDHPGSLTARGAINPADLTFTTEGNWQKLAWPLSGTPQVQSPQGAFEVSGGIHDYTLKLNTEVLGENIPKGQWSLAGRGSDQALEVLEISGRLLEGEFKSTLNARWQPTPSWQAEFAGQGLNPAAHWQELPGKLSFNGHTAGKLEQGQLQTILNLSELSGTLSGQPVQGKARLELKNQDFNLEALQLKAGGALLDAYGRLSQAWDLRWKLEVPNLGRLLPAASGAISGSGTVNGPREQPQAELNLSVQKLGYGELQVQRLQGEAKVDMSGNSRSRLNLTGAGLQLAGQIWQNLSLQGAGTPREHTLTGRLAGELGEFALAIGGGLKDTVWQGRLTNLAALKTEFGDWRLETPAALRASSRQASAERLCLSSKPTRLCLQGQWDAANGATGRLSLEKLAASRFASLLPENLRIDTSLSGEVTGSHRPDGALQGQANLDISPGKLSLTANGSPVQVSLGGGYLRAQARGKDAEGRFRLDLGEAGQLESALQVSDLTGQPRLAGKLTGEVKKLGLVSALMPQLQNISGRLLANVDLSGQLPVPAITGEVRLVEAAADIPEAGTRLQDVQLTASGSGQGPLRFSGSARSGPGRLELSGQLEPASRQLDLAIKGENFQALNSAALQASISPDLKLAMLGKQVRVDGQVAIPKAYLSPPQGGGPGKVGASPDVVIVKDSRGSSPEPAVTALEIFARIRVILGEDIFVEAAGFKGKLSGNLLVEQSPQLAPRGTGNVEVVAGDYKVYGQEINIERGRLLFGGGPIDNPGLDLRVARRIDEVTAGAQVRGTLKNPVLKLFSEPPMADSTILSYLVFGRPPQEGTQEGAMLYQAATALGMSGGNVLTRSISDKLGLDTFSFEGSDQQNASLMIGKYLSPGLYIGYGIGLFEAVNTFTLRYRINKRLQFESTTSGNDSGADLIYILER